MVFPSIPVYLDPPNWNQQQQQQQGHHQQQGSGGGGAAAGEAHHQQLPPPGSMPMVHPEAGMGSSARPVSMAERARMAKVPQPEPALKCPRCDSSNTKFCYFNNYSLSQPRHFCKTCRRYWTRGGALRNVPVGGGCRRNKRSKSSGSGSSKSTPTNMQSGGASSSSSTATSSGTAGAIPSNVSLSQQLPFMASLHPLADYGAHSIGLNFGGMQALDPMEYHIGGSSSSIGMEQWRLQQIQQFPFLGGLEAQAAAAAQPQQVSGLFPFDGEAGVDAGHYTKASGSAGLITQLASVKMEDSSQGLNLSRQYMNMNPRNDQYNWGNNGGGGGSGTHGGWTTDLSGFNSSSGGNLM